MRWASFLVITATDRKPFIARACLPYGQVPEGPGIQAARRNQALRKKKAITVIWRSNMSSVSANPANAADVTSAA